MKKVIYILFSLSISVCAFAQGTQIHLGIPIYHTAGKVTIGNSDVPPLFLNRTGNGTHTVFQRSGSAKGYVGLSNSGTSFYLTSYSDFGLRVNGSGNDSFYLSSAGNVGIGTASPKDRFHIGSDKGVTFHDGGNKAMTWNAYYQSGQWKYLNTEFAAQLYTDYGSNRFSINIAPGGAAEGQVTWTEAFTVKEGGNVGIGTTSPNDRLHVSKAGANTRLRIGNNSAYDQLLYFNGAADWSMGMDNSNSNAFTIASTSSLDNSQRFTILSNGNTGIGTTAPSHTLTVQGGPSGAKGINLMDGNSRIYFNGKRAMEGHFTNSRLDIGEGYNKTQIFGNVGMGVIDPSEKLEVNGTIRSKKVKVEASPWPDFVFAPSYELRSLSDLEKYITDNHHLPEVPSAVEVEKEGLDLGKMDATLLQKVEELTLYLIDVNKKQEQLIKEVADLKKENAALKKKVNEQ